MEATKFRLTVVVEVLSQDAIPALLLETVSHLQEESVEGTLVKADGDCVKWGITSDRVSF